MIARKLSDGRIVFAFTKAEAVQLVGDLVAQLADAPGSGSKDYVCSDTGEHRELQGWYAFMVQGR